MLVLGSIARLRARAEKGDRGEQVIFYIIEKKISRIEQSKIKQGLEIDVTWIGNTSSHGMPLVIAENSSTQALFPTPGN